MAKKVLTTENYLEEMKESARRLSMKCDIAQLFHTVVKERYKYDYMDIDMDESGNYKRDEDGNYVYKERNENDWNYEEAIIAKEIVKAIEKALENYCFLD